MKRYEKYKPSGVEWIGEVPAHWNIERLKFLFSYSKAGIWGDDEKGNSDDIVCFRVADFDYEHGCLNLNDNTIRNIDKKSIEGRIIKNNYLLIEKSGGGDTTPVGRVVKVNTDIKATCSNFIHFASVAYNSNATFLLYYFKFLYSNKINTLFFNQTTGIQNLKIQDYLGQTIFLPPLSEQTAIAAYLDKKCGKIDNVVAVQQKRIELLKELKQSIITHAVTRGLDKNAKLKDSGVEWIGEVPEEWEVAPLKRFLSEAMKYGANAPAEEENNLFPRYIRITDIDENGKLKDDDIKSLNNNDSKDYMLEKGDLLFARSGATVGKTYLFDENYRACYAGYLIKAKCEKKLLPKFVVYYTQSSIYDNWKSASFIQSTIQNISAEKYSMLPMLVPPLPEQTAIATYLDKKCAIIDRQIAKVEKQIELLKEYKQSVITECVTGKRKVC